MDLFQHTVESLRSEIERLVAERRELRLNGVPESELELNRRRLVQAQSELAQLLVQQQRPGPAAA